ncbi:MAG: hypothetical protein U9532_04040 ['Conium maculatum' witches'-broom phytoplasma]|nr:hypothetical protein ['Conium maculatum' witches'-broom phytoplasma]
MSSGEKADNPPFFVLYKTADEFEGVKNICPQGADYAKKFGI